MNYHHLHYFWKVAKLGSIARASAELELTQPTISEQIRALEKALDRKMFDRVGRSLVLTADGQRVFAYAEKIFALGAELTSSLERRSTPPATILRIGIERGISSRLVAMFLPAAPFEVFVDEPRALLNQQLDLLVSEQPIPDLHSHRLLNCGTAFLARKKGPVAATEILLPPEPMRSAVRAWLKKKKLTPAVVATFDDQDLLMAFAERTDAMFAVPDSKQLLDGFHRIARAPELRYRLFAHTRERRPAHPALAAMLAKTG